MAIDPPLDSLFVEDLAPWNGNSNAIWLASTLLLHRNIEKFNFPSKLAPERRKQIVSLISKEVGSLKGLDQPRILKSEECTPLDKEFLVEHCLTHEGFIQAVQGEAFIFDKNGTCILTLNIDDHLHFHHIDVKGELEKGWSQLLSLESQIGKAIAYSYSPKFGFLTATPTTSGTGLVISIFMQLSALIHSGLLAEKLEKLKEETFFTAGLLGRAGDYVGDLVVATNQYTLGINEESIIATMRNIAIKLVAEEQAARLEIGKKESPEIKDKVARAYGLLVHSYQIETVEALNEIALLKLGLELGWVKGIPLLDLNKLFFSCRRAHLLRHEGKRVSFEEVGHKRADFIHHALKEVSLLI